VEPQALWRFESDPIAAALLSDEIGRRLVRSLRYILGEFGRTLACDAGRSGAWIDNIERVGRPVALVHTLFHTLVEELERGDLDRARQLTDRMLSLGTARPGLAILALDEDEMGPAPASLIGRFADLEEDNRLDLIAPDPAVVDPAIALIGEGLELILRHDPALDGEFRAMVSEIWLVGQAPGHRFTTAAVSCFQNWGGLIVNPAVQQVPLDIVELFAHEATHLLLFAIAMDEALLTNAPEERYHSPLREEARSMDGLFHATIVAARIMRAMLKQADGEGDGSSIGHDALRRCTGCVRLFEQGLETIEAHAKLTPSGRRVLDDSKAFVAANKLKVAERLEAIREGVAAD
jgi:hypothetical protein